jgi:hypothetical protein
VLTLSLARPIAHRPTSRATTYRSRPCPNDFSHPVEGGSADDYDYVSGDPINGFDLDGKCGVFGNPFKKCKAGRKGERGLLWGAFSMTYRHTTIGYPGCNLFCADINSRAGASPTPSAGSACLQRVHT